MMNQTQKRLQIIKLAISITDIETIQLQVAKLRLLEGDKQIEEIVNKLDTKNYAQAQNLITDYIDTPIQKIHQRITPENNYSKTEQELIEKFDFIVKEDDKEDNTESVEETKPFSYASSRTKNIDYESLLQLGVEDVLQDNISIKMTQKDNNKNDFFDTKEEPKRLETEDIPRDTFFDDIQEEEKPLKVQQDEKTATSKHETKPEADDKAEENNALEISESTQKETDEKSESGDTPSKVSPKEEHTEVTLYKPLLTIKQKFYEISQNYPPLYTSEQYYPSVHTWLMRIAYHGYSEKKVYEVIGKARKLAQSTLHQNKAEAAELILLSASTEDRFAKLIFARELYKGELFEKNISDAFKLIIKLARMGYPEALCDLGQFYEHGIGINKDKKLAKQLYKKSMDRGLKRAKKHYDRLTHGLFSFTS